MKLTKILKNALVSLLAVVMIAGLPVLSADRTWAAETALPESTSPADSIVSDDIVVLFDNDVHCAVDGYANLAALKKDMMEKTKYVSVVSNGDFIQGGTIGAISQGQNIIDIMNEVGYDVVTLGNHEFDYQIPQLEVLTDNLKSDVVSCNFKSMKTGKAVYKSYVIKQYGKTKIAYVGITTPESITKSTPAYFQDGKGNFIYGFCSDKTGKALYNRVQKAVNDARKAGADYVVALAHLGTDGITDRWTSTSVIKNTTGIDVMLDGHSHSTFAKTTVNNKNKEKVVVSSTGTKFENIGELVIKKNGQISASLVSTKDYTKTDSEVSEYIAEIKKNYEAELSVVVGKTTVDLTTLNSATGKRAVRNAETNLGDFSTDAIRTVLGADAAIMNGGGIRADIKKGDITYNSLLSVFPWGNMGCVLLVKGQQIKDALELGAKNYPEESGGFLQVSGITYEINTSIPSSVKLDANAMFQSVDGTYRVENVKILNGITGEYEALDVNKEYKLAGINYTLRNGGDGYTMFKDAKVIKDDVMVDYDILTTYLEINLKGTVGAEYTNPSGSGRIVIK